MKVADNLVTYKADQLFSCSRTSDGTLRIEVTFNLTPDDQVMPSQTIHKKIDIEGPVPDRLRLEAVRSLLEDAERQAVGECERQANSQYSGLRNVSQFRLVPRA